MNSMVFIKRVMILLTTVMLICGSIQAQPTKSISPFTGNWVGGFEIGDDWQFITVSFTDESERVEGQISTPLEGFTGKFASVQIDGSHIRCELIEKAFKLLLIGEITSDGISGEAEGAGRKGRFHLIRTAQVDPATMAGYVGAYRFRSGRELLIDSFPDTPNTLMVTDVRAGEVRAFFPVSETKFVAGTALFVPYPTQQVISFRRSGVGVSGLERKWNSPIAETATRVAVRREEVSFKNGDVTFAGTLLLPAAKEGRYPAVVFTRGGGRALRAWCG